MKFFTAEETSRIIEMAWGDRIPFDVIEIQFGLKEGEVRKIMRRELKRSSFRLWRKRVGGRKTKHLHHIKKYQARRKQINTEIK
jgi:uncharacterized protein (TIGR03643 family)